MNNSEIIDYKEILGQMDIKDKISLCSGKDTWHTKAFEKHSIPSMMMSDGPHGLRKQTGDGDMLGFEESVKATCFPTASITACSFDRNLLGTLGAAIAEEAGANHIGMFLGPGINIKRNPLCGRNFEYFSEDPYLAGKLAAAYIAAAQKKGIGTSLKHFACNNQEYFRMASNSLVDERTEREIYLRPFEIAVKEANPASVMCAYNMINGTYCSENRWLLYDVLRVEWGYRGLVVTDWSAVGDRSLGFQAGCDLAMPGGSRYGEQEALRNIKNGSLSENDVNVSAERVLRLVLGAQKALKNHFSYNETDHHELACRMAEQSAVLLKNEDGILPLDNIGEIAIFGVMAENFRYQGYGSSRINATRAEQIRALWPDVPYARGCNEDGSTTPELLAEAAALARLHKTAVIFAGLPGTYETEGIDRADMRMPGGHVRLIEEIAKANPNVVVVLSCGGAVETPWADCVKAILYMGLSGQAGAKAAVNLLTGSVNPCGKLAETWPMVYEDCPSSSFYIQGRDAEYREGIYIGYRYYQKSGMPVRFPFGSGLSYTTFKYSDLHVCDGSVCATVTNTGTRYGGEIVMLFIRPSYYGHTQQEGIHRPVRELKGFNKVFLEPGESRMVEFPLDERTFAVWNGSWKTYGGEYIVEFGPNCENLPLQVSVMIDGEALPFDAEPDWYRNPSGAPDRDGWLPLLGREIPIHEEKPYTVNSTIKDAARDSRLLRLIWRIFDKQQVKLYGRGTLEYMAMMTMAEQSTLRAVQNETGLKAHAAQALADLANHRPFQAIYHFLN